MEISDRAIRERIEHDLDNTYLVEAGAGTGKTTLLVSRILEIIRLGKADLAKIVAITFTEKAAADLKLRIRRQLEKNIASERSHEIRKRFEKAFFGLERACITTIHGFCANILKDFPVEAKVDPSFDVADESMTNMLYRRAWQRWLWCQIQECNSTLRELLKVGVKPAEISAMALSLSGHRDTLADFSNLQSVAVFIDELRESMDLEIVRLQALAEKCNNHSDKGYEWITCISKQWQFWKILGDEAFQRRLAYGFPVRSAGNQKNWDSPDTMREVKSLLKSLQQQSKNAQANVLHNLTQILVKWLLDFLHFYQREKSSKAFLDFDDLLIYTRNMLKENLQAREQVRENYAYLLVDEFQDTDPLQVEILFFLAESNSMASKWQDVYVQPGKLFLVGDPKQSIYRFRRADIETYEEVKQKLGGCLSIIQNFRSRPEIIDWVNLVFSRLICPPIDGSYQPKYEPLHAFRNPSPKKPVVFLNTANLQKQIGEIVRQETYAIAWAINNIVKRWPVGDNTRLLRYSDIAILARRFSYMEFFEEALQEFDIPYQVVGSKSYYSCLEVKSFLSLLRSLQNPCNSSSLIATLRSPIFSVCDEDILRWQHNRRDLDYRNPEERETYIGQILVLLDQLHRKIDTLPIPLLLEEILARTGMAFTFLEMSQGEQRVANIMKFLEMAHSLPRVGVCDFHSFVQWLDELERNEQEEPQSLIHEKDSDSVHIFSIHRSKGLEFPVIFLGDLAAASPCPSGILLDHTKKIAMRMKGSLRLQTKNYPKQAEEEKKRAQAEEKRLLYVAMTRAKDYLVIPLAAVGRGYMKYFDSFLPSLPPEKNSPYAVLNVPTDSRNAATPRSLEENRQTCKYPQYLEKIDDYRKKRSEIIETAGKTPPRILLNREEQGKIAFVVRKVLAHLEPLASRDMFLPGEMEALLSNEAKAKFLSESETEQARRMLLGAISSPLLLRAQNSGELYRRLPFALQLYQVVLEGSIDLCFLEKNAFTIVSYDTNTVVLDKIDETSQALYALVLEHLTHCKVRETAVFFLKTNAVRMTTVTRELLEKGQKWLECIANNQ